MFRPLVWIPHFYGKGLCCWFSTIPWKNEILEAESSFFDMKEKKDEEDIKIYEGFNDLKAL